MVKLKDVPDLSRFIRRNNKLPIYNTVLLLVGEESVEVSGCVISLKSKVLQDLAGCQREVYLDQFSGELEGVQDAVELLYGGDVDITEGNVKTVLKFSVIYQVKDLYNMVLKWVKENIRILKLYEMIEFGVAIERLCQDNNDILKICTSFIRDHVKDGLSKLSQTWPLRNNMNCVKFLVQKDILAYTLPILSQWISSDSDINFVISEFEVKGLVETLHDYGDDSVALLDKMVEKVEVMDTSKKVMQLQSMGCKRRKVEQASSSGTTTKKKEECASWFISDAHIGTLTGLYVTNLEINRDQFEFSVTSNDKTTVLPETKVCVPWPEIEKVETHFSPRLHALVIHIRPHSDWPGILIRQLEATLTTPFKIELDLQNVALFKRVISLELVKPPPPTHLKLMSNYIARYRSNEHDAKWVIPRDAKYINNFLPNKKQLVFYKS